MDLLGDGLVGLEPLPGGFSGETFLGETAGERTVVRIYAGRGAQRGAEAPEIDAAVMELVRGLVPVPEVLEVRRADPRAGVPGILVTSYVAASRLDDLLDGADDDTARRLGATVGAVVARLAQMPTTRAGTFEDGRLGPQPLPPEMSDLEAWVEARLPGSALEGWSARDRSALRRLASHGQDVLDEVRRTCLVHSDFNPKNILVHDDETVAAVLDWEYAHSGSPYADLGNLLRFETGGVFAREALDTVRAGVADMAGLGIELVVERARAADLWALVDLAARAGTSPVADRAHETLLQMARAGELVSPG